MRCILKKRPGRRDCRKCEITVCEYGNKLKKMTWNEFLRLVYRGIDNSKEAKRKPRFVCEDEENIL